MFGFYLFNKVVPAVAVHGNKDYYMRSGWTAKKIKKRFFGDNDGIKGREDTGIERPLFLQENMGVQFSINANML